LTLSGFPGYETRINENGYRETRPIGERNGERNPQ
jgi:hypothetical protein